jgi:hypothetical protein
MTVHPTVDDLAQLCAAMARRCAGEHGGDPHRRPDADEMVSLLTILRPARERRRQPARVLELVRSGKRRRR